MKFFQLITTALGATLLATFIAATPVDAQTAVQLASTTPAAFRVGEGPEGIVTDGASVFVANQFSNTVTKLNASDGAIIGEYKVGHRPLALAFDGAFVWVANYLSNNVMKLDPASGAVVGT